MTLIMTFQLILTAFTIQISNHCSLHSHNTSLWLTSLNTVSTNPEAMTSFINKSAPQCDIQPFLCICLSLPLLAHMCTDNGTHIWSFLTEGQRPVGFPLLCQHQIPLPPFSNGRLNISILSSALSESTTRALLICLDNTQSNHSNACDLTH